MVDRKIEILSYSVAEYHCKITASSRKG